MKVFSKGVVGSLWLRRVAAMLVAMLVFHAAPGNAQNRPIPPPSVQKNSGGGGFNPLNSLFGLFGDDVKERRPVKVAKKPTPAKPKLPKLPKLRVSRDPAKPKITEEPKDADARVILVVGDEMAEGLAEGLEVAYAKTSSVKITSLVERKQGLVKSDEYDFAQEVEHRLQAELVTLVVVSLGTHDMANPAMVKDAFRSPEWELSYKKQLSRLVKAVRSQKKPLIWVGLAPARDPGERADFSYVNDLMKSVVDENHGAFIDLWEVFLNEEGEFAVSGPDVDGKTKRLRARDGLGFTWAGFRKIAFFVKQEITRTLGALGAFVYEEGKGDPNFIVLTGRMSSLETDLIGGAGQGAQPAENTLNYRIILEGETPLPVAGRVDDYRLHP